MSSPIAVVGAGYAGCAAAVTLAAAGRRVVLFEASRHLGGRARRVQTAHGVLDNGQHILAGAYRETLRLMRLVGADPERLLLRLPLSLILPGEMVLRAPRLPAPWHLAAALLGAQGLSRRERLAAARFMAWLQWRRFRLPADGPVAELLRRQRQPDRLCRVLWEPLCLAALNTPTTQASAQVFACVLRDSLGGDRHSADLLLPKTDLSALFPEPAADFLRQRGSEVRSACPVRRIKPLADGQFELQGHDFLGTFGAVILAVAPYHAGTLLPTHPAIETTHSALAHLRYAPILTCTLAYPHPVTLPGPMLGFAQGNIQWLFDRQALVGGPDHQITAVISAPERKIPDEELLQEMHRQISAIHGASLPAPIWHQIITERRATFSCTPHLIRPDTHTGLPGLLLAGDYLLPEYPATLESAVRSGVMCGEQLLKP